LSRLHPLGAQAASPAPTTPAAPAPVRQAPSRAASAPAQQPPTWNTSPLVPDLPDGDDEIPF
ncbi:MAG: single-stranded DNA-binding protein, partial [Vulcanococcus sp.]